MTTRFSVSLPRPDGTGQTGIPALDAAGATWVEFTIAGSTHREHVQCIQDTAGVLRSAGLLAQP